MPSAPPEPGNIVNTSRGPVDGVTALNKQWVDIRRAKEELVGLPTRDRKSQSTLGIRRMLPTNVMTSESCLTGRSKAKLSTNTTGHVESGQKGAQPRSASQQGEGSGGDSGKAYEDLHVRRVSVDGPAHRIRPVIARALGPCIRL